MDIREYLYILQISIIGSLIVQLFILLRHMIQKKIKHKYINDNINTFNVKNFTIDNLPHEYKNNNIFNLIKILDTLTVKIKIDDDTLIAGTVGNIYYVKEKSALKKSSTKLIAHIHIVNSNRTDFDLKNSNVNMSNFTIYNKDNKPIVFKYYNNTYDNIKNNTHNLLYYTEDIDDFDYIKELITSFADEYKNIYDEYKNKKTKYKLYIQFNYDNLDNKYISICHAVKINEEGFDNLSVTYYIKNNCIETKINDAILLYFYKTDSCLKKYLNDK